MDLLEKLINKKYSQIHYILHNSMGLDDALRLIYTHIFLYVIQFNIYIFKFLPFNSFLSRAIINTVENNWKGVVIHLEFQPVAYKSLM